MIRFLPLLLIGLFISSCTTYNEEQKSTFDDKIEAYLKKKKVECKRSSSGLYYKILAPGEGELIKLKDEVTFTYKGSLLNGNIFDDRKEPVTFKVQELIGGWKEVMMYLRPGGKAFLVCPPQLGYGEHELEDIPPNSILVFELEVKSVR